MDGYQFLIITPGDWNDYIIQNPNQNWNNILNFKLDHKNNSINYVMLNSNKEDLIRDVIPYQKITISELSNRAKLFEIDRNTDGDEINLLEDTTNLPIFTNGSLVLDSKSSLKNKKIVKGSLKKKITN